MERSNMKATDLMIGDWVLAEGKPLQVTNVSCLGGDIIRVMNPIMSYDVAYASNIIALSNGAKDINKIEPIPITPEILEKNGFVIFPHNDEDNFRFNYSEYYDVEGEFDLHIENGIRKGSTCGEIYEYVITAIHYVHELQHALRLCGIDKEVVV